MITLFHIIGLMIFKYAINYKYDSWLGLAKNYWVPYKKNQTINVHKLYYL